jgi:hypothetical protein
MQSTHSYPEFILRTLRETEDLDINDSSRDNEFNSMSPGDVFDKCLEWEGIVGYGMWMRSLVKGAFGVDLDK